MNEWEVVYTALSEAEAQIVVGRLATENIRSWVQYESVGQTIGLTVGALGGYRVLVNPEDAERAISLLETDVTDEADALLDDGEDGE